MHLLAVEGDPLPGLMTPRNPCLSATGYNGNIFESNKGPKGGAFDEDQTSFRFVVGKGQVIRGLEEGVVGVKAGGVRQIVVPPEVGPPQRPASITV